jgi:hypothetical protein
MSPILAKGNSTGLEFSRLNMREKKRERRQNSIHGDDKKGKNIVKAVGEIKEKGV